MVLLCTERRCAIWKVIVLIWLAGAVTVDLSTYKIPNRFCLIMAGSGMVLQFVLYGSDGLLHSLVGMLIPFAVLFGFFSLRIIGGGDVKLFIAIGAYAGWDIGKILLYACISSGIAAIVRLLSVCIQEKQQPTEPFGGLMERLYRHKMHLSVPIAFGFGIYTAGGWLFGV